MLVDILISLIGATLVLADRAPFEIDGNGVKLVKAQRFDGNLEECRVNEVCADVFTFNRTLDDGTSQPESRFIQNCRCPDYECGDPAYDPLIFHETRTQSMVTCFPRQSYINCDSNAIAKEQHNLGNYVFYRINCVCPNNNNPQDFFNKMTERTYRPGMGGPRTRLFRCRDTN